MSEPSNDYRVGNSSGYAWFCIALHVGAGAMVLLTGILETKSMFGLALVVLLWGTLAIAALSDLRHRGVWRGQQAIAHISISAIDQRWRLCQRSGQWFGPAVVTGGRVMNCAIWLHLRDGAGRRRVLCVAADAMSPQMFRRLRVAANGVLGQ